MTSGAGADQTAGMFEVHTMIEQHPRKVASFRSGSGQALRTELVVRKHTQRRHCLTQSVDAQPAECPRHRLVHAQGGKVIGVLPKDLDCLADRLMILTEG